MNTGRIRTERKVRRFARLLDRHADSLRDRFGAAELAVMREEMLAEYRALIPQLPFVGGRRNPWHSNLAASAWALAIHRVVGRHGGSVEDSGKVAYDYMRGTIERVPRRLRPLLLRPRRRMALKQARFTRRHSFPEDWVCAVVDGTGQPFAFGVDVTECAIVKFLHTQGADELTPFLCHLDYVTAEAAGVGLTRTKTLAWGCDRCDFRWATPGRTTATWPPEFVERDCGRPAPSRSAEATVAQTGS